MFWFFNFDGNDSHCVVFDQKSNEELKNLTIQLARCYQRKYRLGHWLVLENQVPEIWRTKPELHCAQKLLRFNSWDFLVLERSRRLSSSEVKSYIGEMTTGLDDDLSEFRSKYFVDGDQRIKVYG